MKALSIKQPWAFLIVAGLPLVESVDLGNGLSTVRPSGKAILKDIENRRWPLPQWFKTPQRVAVHAGQTPDSDDAMYWLMNKGFAPATVLMLWSNMVPRGVLIGEVDIVGCVTESDSPWFVGPYGFVLANPAVYETPIPYKGRLGFFDIDSSVLSPSFRK